MDGASVRLAYADPPYVGQAKRHYAHDPSGIEAAEVNYADLLNSLSDYLCMALHPDVRVAAWVKPFCSWKPSHRVQYAWEPVLFVPARPKGSRKVPSVRDYVSANITTRRGTHGAKPDAFCDWIIDLLGWQPGDSLDDLYPGSGTMAQALERQS